MYNLIKSQEQGRQSKVGKVNKLIFSLTNLVLKTPCCSLVCWIEGQVFKTNPGAKAVTQQIAISEKNDLLFTLRLVNNWLATG